MTASFHRTLLVCDSIGMKARVIEDGTVVAASREQLLAPRQHNLQIWVAGHVAQAQQSAGSAEVEPGTGAASGEGGSTRSEVCDVNRAANTTGLGLFLKHAKTLASAGRSDEAVEIADAVLSCHALSWEAAVAAALAGTYARWKHCVCWCLHLTVSHGRCSARCRSCPCRCGTHGACH